MCPVQGGKRKAGDTGAKERLGVGAKGEAQTCQAGTKATGCQGFPDIALAGWGRLRAKPGKAADVRTMECFPFHTIYKTAGLFCFSQEPPGETFIGQIKGADLPHSQEPQPLRALKTTKRRL